MQDTDFDTLPDAFETLITQTDPNAANTLANAGGNTNLTAWLTDQPPHLYLKSVLKVFGFEHLFDPCSFPGLQVDREIEKTVWDSATGGTETKYFNRKVCLLSNLVEFTEESVTFWEPDDTGCFLARLDGGPWSVGCTNEDGIVPASPRHGPYGTDWDHETTGEFPPGSGAPTFVATKIKETLQLDTRGPGLSTKSRLYRLSARIRAWEPDGITYTNVPPEQISVLGQTLDADYHTFVMLPDNSSHDVTPKLLSACATFAFFDVSAERIDVQLLRGGLDVTDGFSTVWVGEQISLTCQTDPAGYVLSNMVWTVPGNTISNWAADASRTYFEPSYPKTNAGVAYYWLDGHQRAEVTVQADLGGFTLLARTTFAVQRPNATITAQIQNVVAVDNNWLAAPALHFGYAPSGIKFTYATDVGAGFTYQWVQTANSVRRIRKADDGFWYRAAKSGLDTDYPYKKGKVNGVDQEWASDSPGTALDGDFEYVISESFTMHLMFKPQVNAANTIWVPLRKINWAWFGHGTLSNGVYSLVDGGRAVDDADMDSTSHPQWDANIDPFNFVPE